MPRSTPPSRRCRVRVHFPGRGDFDVFYPRDVTRTPEHSPLRRKITGRLKNVNHQTLAVLSLSKQAGESYEIVASDEPWAHSLKMRLDVPTVPSPASRPSQEAHVSHSDLADLKREFSTMSARLAALEQEGYERERRNALRRKPVTLMGIVLYGLSIVTEANNSMSRVGNAWKGQFDHRAKDLLFDAIEYPNPTVTKLFAENRAFRRIVSTDLITKVNNSFAVESRHDQAHPESSDARLLSDGLQLLSVAKDSEGVKEAVHLLCAAMGEKRFDEILVELRRDDGFTYERFDEEVARGLKRLWM